MEQTTSLWAVALGSGVIASGITSVVQLWNGRRQRESDRTRDSNVLRRSTYAEYLLWFHRFPGWVVGFIEANNPPGSNDIASIRRTLNELAQGHWEVATPMSLVASGAVLDAALGGTNEALAAFIAEVAGQTSELESPLDLDEVNRIVTVAASNHITPFIGRVTNLFRAELSP